MMTDEELRKEGYSWDEIAEIHAATAVAQARAKIKVVQEDIDRFELRLGLRPYNKAELERPSYEARLQEQVNGYLSLGEKPPANLLAATKCAAIFPKSKHALGASGEDGVDGGDGGAARGTISPGVTLGGIRIDDDDLGAASGRRRGTSASTLRSKERLRQEAEVFSSVQASKDKTGVARWAEDELNRQETCMRATVDARATRRRPWISPISAPRGGQRGMPPQPTTPGGTSSAYHVKNIETGRSSYPSWFDDEKTHGGDGWEGGRSRANRPGTSTGSRPVSAAHRKESQLLAHSMRLSGRARSARAVHAKEFLTSSKGGGEFGAAPAGKVSKIVEQRDRAVARRAAHEEREAAREAAEKKARIEEQKRTFKAKVTEGLLHKTMLGDPFTVRKIAAEQAAARRTAARRETVRRIGVEPPVNVIAAANAEREKQMSAADERREGTHVRKFGAFTCPTGGVRAGAAAGQEASAKGRNVDRREAEAITEALVALDEFDAKPLPTMPKNAPMLFRITPED